MNKNLIKLPFTGIPLLNIKLLCIDNLESTLYKIQQYIYRQSTSSSCTYKDNIE